jgi:hypothetical protein
MCLRVRERDGPPASCVTRSPPLVVNPLAGRGIASVAGIERAVGTSNDVDEMGWRICMVVRARREAALFRTGFHHRRQTGNCNPLSKRPHRDTVAAQTERLSGRRARSMRLQGARLQAPGWGATREAPLCFESEENLQPGAKLRSTKCFRRSPGARPVLQCGGSARVPEGGI